VVLCIHGGPFGQDGWALFDEPQVYASAGYAVVLANPRGSAGYGEAHGRAVVGAFGTVDVDDVLCVLDAALRRGDLDESRVGLMGGSYGGYLTSWLAAHHGERFRAAWSERAPYDHATMAATWDHPWTDTLDRWVGGPDRRWDRSPVAHADRIRIPFLIAHSEQDLRCPFGQAQQMFAALRRRAAEVEMLVFPGEGHELTRSGFPRHRVQRLAAVLEWWSRHLRR
jgi:dipeptidyl aminopeptidase/acylaminoacyl peptidase